MPATTFSATGRRKTSVARVELTPGSGQITINDRPFEEYFPTVSLQNQVLGPLHAIEAHKKYDVVARTKGGGFTGQVDAVRLGIARALIQDNMDFRPTLKQEGHLKRDPRAKERKKAGQPGARKRFQFSKR